MYRLNISPNDLTPEIFFSGSLRLTHSFLPSVRGSLVAHVLVDHGLPDALVASFLTRSSALHCACLLSLCLLAVLVSARPARIIKRPCALLVNLVFITIFCSTYATCMSLNDCRNVFLDLEPFVQ